MTAKLRSMKAYFCHSHNLVESKYQKTKKKYVDCRRALYTLNLLNISLPKYHSGIK